MWQVPETQRHIISFDLNPKTGLKSDQNHSCGEPGSSFLQGPRRRHSSKRLADQVYDPDHLGKTKRNHTKEENQASGPARSGPSSLENDFRQEAYARYLRLWSRSHKTHRQDLPRVHRHKDRVRHIFTGLIPRKTEPGLMEN